MACQSAKLKKTDSYEPRDDSHFFKTPWLLLPSILDPTTCFPRFVPVFYHPARLIDCQHSLGLFYILQWLASEEQPLHWFHIFWGACLLNIQCAQRDR